MVLDLEEKVATVVTKIRERDVLFLRLGNTRILWLGCGHSPGRIVECVHARRIGKNSGWVLGLGLELARPLGWSTQPWFLASLPS